ncbi:MAG: DNA polymerase III subunit alpha [Chlamydiae bacterium RIFCSPHIGHO2_12_FULL_49_11]|nr:MAG: DNA polymerase III subunit alpha [Chlamydiae bacterium RIFCSPHIGHO2_12_FULL_49_11]
MLSSLGFTRGFYYYPRIDKEMLRTYSRGLICLSGPHNGKIGSLMAREENEALEKELSWFQEVFGDDFFLSVENHTMSPESFEKDKVHKESWLVQKMEETWKKEARIREGAKYWGEKLGIGRVATHHICYLNREDWDAHEILMGILSGEPRYISNTDSFGNRRDKTINPKRDTLYSHEMYFKSPAEMEALFHNDPEAVANTRVIAGRCRVDLDFSKRYYPVFVPPELEGKKYTEKQRKKEAEQFLRSLAEAAIEKKYTGERLKEVQKKYPGRDPLDVVKERLAYELEVIISKEMCDYILIVYDFIAWAKQHGIPVGPGRGSGAGSIISYLTGITEIEPLRFDLFFERFINPERISYPDIDVDICMERRSEVIEYTIQKYGKDQVAQIITFGKMKAKMAIKDVGRVLGVSLSKVNQIAKLVPEDLDMTIERALELDPELLQMKQTDAETDELIRVARVLEGCIRNTGIHAAGIIISSGPLIETIPICTAKDSDVYVTQFSMKPVESVGMLKIDFLGLKTLTTIQRTVDSLPSKIDWVNLPLDDPATFELLNQGKTSGIFQLESGGMQELAKQLHIDRFEEIMAVAALYRPGPMEMIPSFIQRKHGREPIEYDHEKLVPILEETYGIMVYQEQVMQIAQLLAGYSLGEGDLLRRAMGKKDHEEMERQKGKFIQGAIGKGLSKELAASIFEKIEKFASYGFNKSHAAAYAYLCYVTAYLKANHPREWLAALMTSDIHDITKVAKHIVEAKGMGISVFPPDINESKEVFTALPSAIRFGLKAIKGMGSNVSDAILEERERGGPFETLDAFLRRIPFQKVGKKAIELLIDAGCFDYTGEKRRTLLQHLETNFEALMRQKKERELGVMDLFGDVPAILTVAEGEEIEVLTPLEMFLKEKQLLGFYVSGHPIDLYQEMTSAFLPVPLSDIAKCAHGDVIKIVFIVDTLDVKLSRFGKKYAAVKISDRSGESTVMLWSDAWQKQSSIIAENKVYAALAVVDMREELPRLNLREIALLDEMGQGDLNRLQEQIQTLEKWSKENDRKSKEQGEKKMGKKCTIHLDIDRMQLSHILEFREKFGAFSGEDSVEIVFTSNKRPMGVLTLDPSKKLDLEEVAGYFQSLPYFVDIIY